MCIHVKLLAPPRIDLVILLEIFDRIRCDRRVKSCSKYLFRIANFGKVMKEGISLRLLLRQLTLTCISHMCYIVKSCKYAIGEYIRYILYMIYVRLQ